MTKRLGLSFLFALACAPAFLGGRAIAGSLESSPGQAAPRAQTSAARPANLVSAPPRRVDPRAGGLEIALGEWALTPEALVIRPGRVTFVIRNRGA